MKIYEIGTGYTPIPARIGAATEIVVEELSGAFLKQGQQVEIVDIAADDRQQTDLPIREVFVPECLRGTDVKLGVMHKVRRVSYSIALSVKLWQLLKETEETIVLHFHNQYNLFFFLKLVPSRLRKRALIAYTNHSGVWRQSWDKIENTVKRRYFQEAECMRCADLVFLLNEETGTNVVEHLGVSPDRIVLIGNGVNTDRYHPLTHTEKLRIKQRLGFQDHRVILQVGSVNENKGQLRSAGYLLPLLKKYPDLIFAYAGGIVEAEYQDRITAFARETGMQDRIRYLGMINPGEQLNDVYNAAEATIFPSAFEAFGLVAVESMAAGTPVLVDKDSILGFGSGVLYFDKENAAENIETLIFAEESAYQQICKEIRSFANKNYSWEKVAGAYLAAMKNGMK